MKKDELIQQINELDPHEKAELINKISTITGVGTRVIKSRLEAGEMTPDEAAVIQEYLSAHKENWVMFES